MESTYGHGATDSWDGGSAGSLVNLERNIGPAQHTTLAGVDVDDPLEIGQIAVEVLDPHHGASLRQRGFGQRPEVGQPAGAYWGKSGITAELIGGLAQHETIEAAAKRLIAATRD